MAVSAKIFNGKLNLDTQDFRVPNGDYTDALNITRDSQGTGQDYVVANIQGNRLISFTLPAGINKVIGSYEDRVRFRLYYFIWNSNGNNLWLYYDGINENIVKLIEDLTDTNNIPVLDFNPSKKINHIDVVYRDEGDLVSWTDGNTTPKEANVQTIIDGTYGVIQKNFIEAAKMPPLTPAQCLYQSDINRNANSLRKKLFQFSYAWRYDTFAISTPSTYSKIPLPLLGVSDISNVANNNISIIVETGDKNVTEIEIYMRSNNGDAWNDFVTVVVLNKAQLAIADNSIYQYFFYNDNIYPTPTQNFQYVDGVQVVPLYDWLPQLADTQCQPNGNVKTYAAITENYDNYPVDELDVTLTATNVTNSPPDSDPPQITYFQSGETFNFTILGSVPLGTQYKVYLFYNGNPAIGQTHGVFLVGDYTSVGGDTLNDVASHLYDDFRGFASTPATVASVFMNTIQVNMQTAGSTVFRVDIVAGGGGGDSISTQKTWLWSCSYALGIVYEDEQGRAIPGVTTFTNPNGGDNDFVVNTPDFSLDSTTPQTPVLHFSINHLPPPEAVKFNIVRRRLTFGTFLFYETCDYQSQDGYSYFCLYNIDLFKQQNSLFIYGTAPIVPESRIRIIANISGGGYDGTLFAEDYQVLGVETRTLTGGVSPDNDVPFVKVAESGTVPAYTANMLVMIYTPIANPSNDADSVYWEWGESYDTYTLSDILYHRGKDQDQTASQPATFTFEEGDVYYRTRPMYNDIVGSTPYPSDTVSLMDANYSDYFDSLVTDDGRGQVIAVNARHQFNPVLIRFSLAYQSGTNINGLNRFYPENFEEADRSWDAINKLFIDRRYLYVGQVFNVGIIPILQQIVTDTAGNPLQANSDILLNKIQYPYETQYGFGNIPESFAYGKGIIYGADNNRGIVWQLVIGRSMEAISVDYECNAFFVQNLAQYQKNYNNGNAPSGGVYTGDPTCYGVFNPYTNKYVIALEEINRYDSGGSLIFHQDPFTLCYTNYRENSMRGFESFHGYFPEYFGILNTLMVSFKNGELWKHDSDVYCNFYGEQQDVYVVASFNDSMMEKKSWIGLSETSNVVWDCPEITTQANSFGSTPQSSLLKTASFKLMESEYHASFLRDINSRKGYINGDTLKGNYIVVKFRVQSAADFVYLNAIGIKFNVSNLVPV